MTLGSMLNHFGTKAPTERFSEYQLSAPSHDQHLYYAYEPPVHIHSHVATSKHHYGSGKKNNAAMSALTLLAFLFFLHILQQCLRDHMQAMNTPQIMVMSASREGDQHLAKIDENKKLDKSGINTSNREKLPRERTNENNVIQTSTPRNKIKMTKIKTTDYTPKIPTQKYNFGI